MSLNYQAVLWNRQKKIYDTVLVVGVVIYLALFITFGFITHPNATAETLLIRGFGTAALLLLHIILSIGPLCRLNPRFLPLLYNRRHLGVTMFILALAHGAFSIIQFHSQGDVNPIVSVLISNTQFYSLSRFPFQPLGLATLVILFLMAATSHDFWLANLTPPIWKALHTFVYVAYALIIMHVTLGVLQAETSPVFAITLGIGLVWVLGLHVIAAWKERGVDAKTLQAAEDGFLEVCKVTDIPEKCAHVAMIGGERVAVFKYDGKISAISNVCQHQNGPLGEGRIIDGLVTCPWHGFNYRPADGASPAPFKEKVPTFHVKVVNGRVLVNPRPNLPGTYVEPAMISHKS
jgi:nitrite reductase/ring-hydroxylating ferredoxin subunit/DMSO/TMAO reductase YedYZ heme-binding membrane subunit